METANVPAVLKSLTPEQIAALPQVIGVTELGEGHENVEGIIEVTIPRAKVVQFVSAEAKLPEGERVAPGKFINSLTKQELPNSFMPIFKFTNFIHWNPRKKDDPNFDKDYQPGELIFQTIDVKDTRVQAGINFGPQGQAPKVTRYMNFMCYFPENRLPLILSFAKTSMRGGENLNSLLQSIGGNVWNNKYQIMIAQKGDVGNEYFAIDVKPAGFSTPEERIIGKLWFDMFHKKNLKVDESNDEGTRADANGKGWEE